MAGLMSDMQRREIIATLMKRVKAGGQQKQSISPQFMAQSTPMMQTSAPASAADMGAFNERNKNRALYGKYGKGGLMREQMANRLKIAKERASANRYGSDRSFDSSKYKADAESDWRGKDRALDRKEYNSKYNTDTFGGEPLGTEQIRAKAMKDRADALKEQARKKLVQQPKVFDVQEYDKDTGNPSTSFYSPGVGPNGQPAMLKRPTVDPSAVPNQAQIPGKPKKTPKQKNDYNHWSNWY